MKAYYLSFPHFRWEKASDHIDSNADEVSCTKRVGVDAITDANVTLVAEIGQVLSLAHVHYAYVSNSSEFSSTHPRTDRVL